MNHLSQWELVQLPSKSNIFFLMYKAVSSLIMVHTLWLDGNFQPFFGINPKQNLIQIWHEKRWRLMHPATAPPAPPAPSCVAERNGSITMVPPRHRRWPPMAVPRCQKHPKWCVGSIDNQICWVFHFEGGNHIDVCFLSLKRGYLPLISNEGCGHIHLV